MVYKLSLTFLLVFFLTQQGASQVEKLSIGDTIPDIEFSVLCNFDSEPFRISELRNKNVIIDVWNKWCSACISLMPKVEKLQREYKDSIVFITMTNDSESDYIVLKEKSRILKEVRLNSVIEDTVLHRLIPPPSVPFYIWIGKGGVLRATSNADHLTRYNLNRFVAGEALDLEFSKKTELDLESSNIDTMIFKRPKQHEGVTYYSMLREEDNIIQQPLFLVRSNINDGVGYDLIDNSIISLYKLAYGFEDDVDVLLRDSVISNEIGTGNRYSYFIRFEPGKRPANISMIPYLRRDLRQKFRVQVNKVTFLRSVYVLRMNGWAKRPDASDRRMETRMENAARGIYIKNGGMSSLVRLLKVRLGEIDGKNVKILDETDIKYNFDLDVSFDENSIDSINRALQAYGIEIIKSRRMIETLVLAPLRE